MGVVFKVSKLLCFYGALGLGDDRGIVIDVILLGGFSMLEEEENYLFI